MIGFFESPSFPACYHFFPVWIPIQEKTLMIPAIASGMYMGEIIGFSLSGVFVSTPLRIGSEWWGGWQLVFYVFGLLGIVWFPYWALFAYESPDHHPKITEDEKALIKAGKGYATLKRVDEEEDSKYQHLLHVEPVENSGTHVVYDNTFTAPAMESTNPMNRFSFSSTDGADPVNPPEPARTMSLLTDEGDREELAKRIPWKNFFTHPVSLTLLLNNWTYVSLFRSFFHSLIFFERDLSDLRYSLKCLPFSLMF